MDIAEAPKNARFFAARICVIVVITKILPLFYQLCIIFTVFP